MGKTENHRNSLIDAPAWLYQYRSKLPLARTFSAGVRTTNK